MGLGLVVATSGYLGYMDPFCAVLVQIIIQSDVVATITNIPSDSRSQISDLRVLPNQTSDIIFSSAQDRSESSEGFLIVKEDRRSLRSKRLPEHPLPRQSLPGPG